MKNFWPIGLCNTNYKLIIKVVVNRIKTLLPRIIGLSQSSFLATRKSNDHSIIVQEYITHFTKIKEKNPNMILKIDLEKVFDRLE